MFRAADPAVTKEVIYKHGMVLSRSQRRSWEKIFSTLPLESQKKRRARYEDTLKLIASLRPVWWSLLLKELQEAWDGELFLYGAAISQC